MSFGVRVARKAVKVMVRSEKREPFRATSSVTSHNLVHVRCRRRIGPYVCYEGESTVPGNARDIAPPGSIAIKSEHTELTRQERKRHMRLAVAHQVRQSAPCEKHTHRVVLERRAGSAPLLACALYAVPVQLPTEADTVSADSPAVPSLKSQNPITFESASANSGTCSIVDAHSTAANTDNREISPSPREFRDDPVCGFPMSAFVVVMVVYLS